MANVYEKSMGGRTGVDASSLYSTGGQLAGSLIEAVEDPSEGRQSVGGAIATGAGTGAAAGAVFGPWGAAVGGVVGGAAGGIKAKLNNDKIDAAIEEAEMKKLASNNLSSYSNVINTQAPMYEKGTPGAMMDHTAEVERDELVLRKDAEGKFRLIADFRGGKPHSMGGELIELSDSDNTGQNEVGDVVFPKEKRKHVMRMLKQGNHVGIETERMKLPKDVPADGKLQDGVGETRADKVATIGKAVIDWQNKNNVGYAGNLDYDKEIEVLDAIGSDLYTFDPTRTGPSRNMFGLPSESPESVVNRTTELYNPYNMPFDNKTGVEQQLEEQNESVLPTTTTGRVASTGTENIPMEKLKSKTYEDALPEISLPDKVGPDSIDTITYEEAEAAQQAEKADLAGKAISGSSGLGEALNYAPAAISFLESLKSPDKVDRHYVNPALMQYDDMSEAQRAEVRRQSRVQQLAADQTSGGSSQVARGRKELATASERATLEQINSREVQRADAVNKANVGIMNEADTRNTMLDVLYDDLDAKNQAAQDAQKATTDRLLFEAIKTNARDRAMKRNQNIMLKNLGTRSYSYDENLNKVLTTPVEADVLEPTNYVN